MEKIHTNEWHDFITVFMRFFYNLAKIFKMIKPITYLTDDRAKNSYSFNPMLNFSALSVDDDDEDDDDVDLDDDDLDDIDSDPDPAAVDDIDEDAEPVIEDTDLDDDLSLDDDDEDDEDDIL